MQYEGTIDEVDDFAAWLPEGDPAPTDTGAASISRCPNGGDTDNNAGDFSATTTHTPGAVNSCSTGTNPGGPKN